MARFDPCHQHDRFTVEARASELRAEELDKVLHALSHWAHKRQHGLAVHAQHLADHLRQRLHAQTPH